MIQLIALVMILSMPIWIVIFSRLLELVYLWQVKEFRIDRVLSHMRYEGRLSYDDEFVLCMRIAFFVMLVIYYLSPLSTVLGITIIVALIFYDYRALHYLRLLIHNKLHRPSLRSPRNMLILLLVLIISALPFIYLFSLIQGLNTFPIFQNIVTQGVMPQEGETLAGMLLAIKVEDVTIISLPLFVSLFATGASIGLDIILPILVGLAVILTSPLAFIRRKIIIWQARQKIKRYPKLKVVAVTGSYGKTTTKEILAQLLSKNFTVVKTEKNNNTEVGIALTILKKINAKTDVFIAEIGAYKLGETEACAKIIQPDVAIVTGIDEQHFSLYGSFQNIIDSTLEIVKTIEPGGSVVLNGDNEYCMRIAGKIDLRKRIYFTDQFQKRMIGMDEAQSHKNGALSPRDDNMYISEINSSDVGQTFTIGYRNHIEQIKTNIQAKHNIGNIAASVLVANELGLEIDEIVRLINQINFELPYLTTKEGINLSTLIDDGYNINPSGYYAGLKFLAQQRTTGRKWVLTQGFVELGELKEQVYKQVAKETVRLAKGLMTTDIDLYVAIKDVDPEFQAIYVDNVFSIPTVFAKNVEKYDVILIEGPLPSKVLREISAEIKNN